MRNFKQDRGNRGKRFGGDNRGGWDRDRGRGPITMHQAVCSQCGKSCEVPFRPTSGKPVYCNVCFGGKKEGRSDRGGDRFSQKSFDTYKAPVKTDDEIKRQFDMLNAKIDRIIKSLEEKKEVKEAIVKVKKNKTAVAVKKKKTKK